jgi:hypothetical protein
VGNAYFSLSVHALPAGWRRLAVVTSDFHMPRTRALFAGIYGLAGRALAGDPDWCVGALAGGLEGLLARWCVINPLTHAAVSQAVG